jgi:hypothetical protein
VTLYLGGADRNQLDPILDACVAVYNGLDEDGQVDFKGKAKDFLRTFRCEITKNMVEPLLLLRARGSPRSSGCYWLLGVVVGNGAATGAGVVLKHSIRIFQSSPSRTTDQ